MLAGITSTAVPVGRITGGTHLVQSVQSAHVVASQEAIRAALSVHHHTDDSSGTRCCTSGGPGTKGPWLGGFRARSGRS